eukprot:3936071-Rhodomonas_salina.1
MTLLVGRRVPREWRRVYTSLQRGALGLAARGARVARAGVCRAGVHVLPTYERHISPRKQRMSGHWHDGVSESTRDSGSHKDSEGDWRR